MDKLELVGILFEKIKEERKLDRNYQQFLLKKNMKREANFYQERIDVVDIIMFELNDILEGHTTEKDNVSVTFLRD